MATPDDMGGDWVNGRFVPSYQQNVTMTNPGPNGPVTQGAASGQFATPGTAQWVAQQTGGQAVGRTPSVGSFSTGDQQMVNYGGSDLNAGLMANNFAQYGNAPGSYGQMLNSRDIARSQGQPEPVNPWDNTAGIDPIAAQQAQQGYQDSKRFADRLGQWQQAQTPMDAAEITARLNGTSRAPSYDQLHSIVAQETGYDPNHPTQYGNTGYLAPMQEARTTPGWQGMFAGAPAGGGGGAAPAAKDSVSRDPRANTPGYDQYGNPTGSGSNTPGTTPGAASGAFGTSAGGGGQDTSSSYDWNATHQRDANGNLISAGGPGSYSQANKFSSDVMPGRRPMQGGSPGNSAFGLSGGNGSSNTAMASQSEPGTRAAFQSQWGPAQAANQWQRSQMPNYGQQGQSSSQMAQSGGYGTQQQPGSYGRGSFGGGQGSQSGGGVNFYGRRSRSGGNSAF